MSNPSLSDSLLIVGAVNNAPSMHLHTLSPFTLTASIPSLTPSTPNVPFPTSLPATHTIEHVTPILSDSNTPLGVLYITPPPGKSTSKKALVGRINYMEHPTPSTSTASTQKQSTWSSPPPLPSPITAVLAHHPYLLLGYATGDLSIHHLQSGHLLTILPHPTFGYLAIATIKRSTHSIIIGNIDGSITLTTLSSLLNPTPPTPTTSKTMFPPLPPTRTFPPPPSLLSSTLSDLHLIRETPDQTVLVLVYDLGTVVYVAIEPTGMRELQRVSLVRSNSPQCLYATAGVILPSSYAASTAVAYYGTVSGTIVRHEVPAVLPCGTVPVWETIEAHGTTVVEMCRVGKEGFVSVSDGCVKVHGGDGGAVESFSLLQFGIAVKGVCVVVGLRNNGGVVCGGLGRFVEREGGDTIGFWEKGEEEEGGGVSVSVYEMAKEGGALVVQAPESGGSGGNEEGGDEGVVEELRRQLREKEEECERWKNVNNKLMAQKSKKVKR